MRAGKLRYSVTFMAPDKSADGTDNPGRWRNIITVDADIRPVSVQEIEAAQGRLMQTDLAVECRWCPPLSGMDNQWRVASATLPDECRVITANNPDLRHRLWRVICRSQSLTDESDSES